MPIKKRIEEKQQPTGYPVTVDPRKLTLTPEEVAKQSQQQRQDDLIKRIAKNLKPVKR